MAYYKFVKAAFEDKPIEVYNNGEMQRDFTYIDDIVEGVVRVIDKPAESSSDFATNPSPDRSSAPYRIYNIGNSHPIRLLDFISIIETILNKKIEKHFLPMQIGDVITTYADIEDIEQDFEFRPSMPIKEGVRKFVQWYKNEC
jgi:UDP-glucuronate 4-epimerase